MREEVGELLSQWEQEINLLCQGLHDERINYVAVNNNLIKYHLLNKKYDELRKIWSKHADGN